MDTQQFWRLIKDARAQVADPADSEAVAFRAAALLSVFPRDEIIAAEPVLKGLLAASYGNALWAAASLINGGCGDDGFGYFRGWLIAQGRDVFEQSVADPDSLAGHPAIGPPRTGRPQIECEETLYIVSRAHRAALGQYLAHARRAGGTARSAARLRRGSPAIDTAKVREWAKGQGIEVKDRGRVPADVVEQYKTAAGA